MLNLFFGTAFTDRQDGIEVARLAIDKLLDRCFPTRPDILAVVPGAIFLSLEEDEEELVLPVTRSS